MTTITVTSDKPVVVLEASEYRNLLERLEDLEDLMDAQEALKEYDRTGGIPFDEFIKSLEDKK